MKPNDRVIHKQTRKHGLVIRVDRYAYLVEFDDGSREVYRHNNKLIIKERKVA